MYLITPKRGTADKTLVKRPVCPGFPAGTCRRQPPKRFVSGTLLYSPFKAYSLIEGTFPSARTHPGPVQEKRLPASSRTRIRGAPVRTLPGFFYSSQNLTGWHIFLPGLLPAPVSAEHGVDVKGYSHPFTRRFAPAQSDSSTMCITTALSPRRGRHVFEQQD